MDSHAHDQQQKDFLSSFFPTEPADHLQHNFDGQHHSIGMYFNQASPTNHPSIGMQQSLPQNANAQHNMDMLGNLMQIQGVENQAQAGTMSQQTTPYSPQSLLEQQFKLTQLQQLQQLQNQIFQQQIALISGQAGGILQGSPSTSPRGGQPTSYNGLPTPGPSAELHPHQPSMEFVSPMILNNFMDPHEGFQDQSIDRVPSMVNRSTTNRYGPPRGSTSAPEHIAFRTSPSHRALPSPAELDFDISPLTSPWLGAHQQSTQNGSNKRNASSSGDESNMQPSRKRQSPAIRPTNPSQKKSFRTSKSAASTPLLRSTRSRKGSTAGEACGDTPSPVDLSMPPPAPPSNQAPSSSSSGASAEANHQPSSPDFNAQLTPVTPASIMNLGRLGINSSLTPARQGMPPDSKGKGNTKFKNQTEPPLRSKQLGRNPSGSLVSPGLKAILPAGTTPPLNIGPPAALPAPVVQVRKTSHKAAEQKRRDSLKTTFDDLRGLLPPIPLPSDEKFPDEPILPGALPPRGPPKAGGEGPNKGVSKLQLLMCGNDYIRQLKGRVQRRDEEIDKLRRAVRRLRLGGDAMSGTLEEEEMEELDLDRNLDAIEELSEGLGGVGATVLGDDDADEDPGED